MNEDINTPIAENKKTVTDKAVADKDSKNSDTSREERLREELRKNLRKRKGQKAT